MRSTSPCVIALMSMFCLSFDSTEALMVVFAALAVLMPRSVFLIFLLCLPMNDKLFMFLLTGLTILVS
jgi:hypothetical protein